MDKLLELPFGGKIKHDNGSWYVQYDFKGPDKRYSVSSYIIQGAEIKKFMTALELNFLDYIKLREDYKGKTYHEKARANMSISIGGFYEGVELVENHFYINSKRKLDKVIQSLTKADESAITCDSLE